MKINFKFLVFAKFLVLLVLSSTANSQNNINSTFTCASTSPKSAADCFSQTTNSGNFCCYISGVQSSDQQCVSIPSSSYNGATSYSYNNKLYQLNCNKAATQKTILSPCGTGTELSQGQCAVSSSFVNSCCYYDSTVNAGCYWLGSKFSGTATWGGMNLNCNASYLVYSLAFLFLIFMF